MYVCMYVCMCSILFIFVLYLLISFVCFFTLSQAFETKNALLGQRSTLSNSSGGLSNLSGNPINTYIVYIGW